MRVVFLDTVGMLAIWNTADQWHAAASAAFADIQHGSFEFVTTSYVLVECGNAVARTAFRQNVVDIWMEMQRTGTLIHPSAADERTALEAYAQRKAGQAGIVDQISFVVMQRMEIREAFSNDRHFNAAGLITLF